MTDEINAKHARDPALNGYVCFYNRQRIEVYAATKAEAVAEALRQFKPPKSKQYQVSVLLAEKGGKSVIHTPDF